MFADDIQMYVPHLYLVGSSKAYPLWDTSLMPTGSWHCGKYVWNFWPVRPIETFISKKRYYKERSDFVVVVVFFLSNPWGEFSSSLMCKDLKFFSSFLKNSQIWFYTNYQCQKGMLVQISSFPSYFCNSCGILWLKVLASPLPPEYGSSTIIW